MKDFKEAQTRYVDPIETPMNIDQASQFLHKTKSAIYTMICRGKLQVHKFGGQLYFFRSELVEMIKAGEKSKI
jgi:hypothetical protein